MFKRIFLFTFCLLFILTSTAYTEITGSINAAVGLINYTTSGTVNFDGELEAKLKSEKLGINIYEYIYEQRSDDKILERKEEHDIEATYSPSGSVFVFLNVGSQEDQTLQIDEVYTGAGVGIETDMLLAKAGAYCNESIEVTYWNKDFAKLTIPFGKSKLITEANYQVNIDDEKDYRAGGNMYGKINLTEGLDVKAGYSIDYNNLSEDRTSKILYVKLLFSMGSIN